MTGEFMDPVQQRKKQGTVPPSGSIGVGSDGRRAGTGNKPATATPAADPARGADPVPITGTATFQGSSVTVTVTIPTDPVRHSYSLFSGSNNGSPSTSTQAIATSSEEPAGGTMGTTTGYITGANFTVQVTYRQNGSLVTITYTIPVADINNNPVQTFVLS